MNKYVSSILKTTFALIVILNVSVISMHLVKTDDNEKYKKTNYISYLYDNENEIIKEEIKAPEIVKPEEKPVAETPKEEIKEPENTNSNQYTVLDTFIGAMTAYGPDCVGCGGKTSTGYDLRNGNIYYQDNTFGSLRVLAADKQYPFGTVFRVSGLKIYDEPFLAIVLDRGGAITGTKMDLAFDSESNPLVSQIGYSRNIQYEVLRYGW